jgi:hypothetical protein
VSNQSGTILGLLLAAFVIWLAVNDRLKVYTAVLWGPTSKPTPSGTPVIDTVSAASNLGGSGSVGSGLGSLGDALGVAGDGGTSLLEGAEDALPLIGGF